ncbi:MAG: hypothetical protein HKO57_06370 [Akkermansiaceae bacterium]|nr:hypothetical protein [Akkermansiaceae bacterium]
MGFEPRPEAGAVAKERGREGPGCRNESVTAETRERFGAVEHIEGDLPSRGE